MAVDCLPSNPDVSGIGVRRSHLRSKSYMLLARHHQSIGMLAVAFAILFTTIILAKGAGGDQMITSYHAAVVLDLSWMNNTSKWIWLFSMPTIEASTMTTPLELTGANGAMLSLSLSGSCWGRMINLAPAQNASGACPEHHLGHCLGHAQRIAQRIWCIAQRIWGFVSEQPVLTLGSIHLSLLAAVGIWLYRSACTILIKAIAHCIIGNVFPCSIPGLNLIPPFAFFLMLHISYNWCRGHHQSPSPDFELQPSYSFPGSLGPIPNLAPHQIKQGGSSQHSAVLLVAINILFIVDIELTLRHNKGDQTGNEATWGFGQVLALLLLIIPLRDAWGALQDIREKLKSAQQQFDELLLRECQAEPGFGGI
ncbi:hypothetical protein B0H14DRAFT_3886381 [Mycena olivaceomarginata]|nr:hypothetical protein B0H14DRAFT_3886381 [Mycena olivaceomarginata]